jgi:hypothetical protein
MISADTHDQIVNFCRYRIAQDPEAVMGDGLDDSLIGKVALDRIKLEHPLLGPVEINATREQARPPFEWLYEITFRGEDFQHYLVLAGGEIVETYGKNVVAVDDDRALALLKNLQQLNS